MESARIRSIGHNRHLRDVRRRLVRDLHQLGCRLTNQGFQVYIACSLTPWRLATVATGSRSVSRDIPTICFPWTSTSSSCLLSEASFLTNRRPENPEAGRYRGAGRNCRPCE